MFRSAYRSVTSVAEFAALVNPGILECVGLGMGSDRYVFRSEWRLSAGPDRVFAALADVEAYPAWWPQVRATRRLSDSSGEMTCRSLLPYDLVITLSQEIADPVAGVLAVRLTGDIAGTSRWTVSADPRGGTLAVFDEDVEVHKTLVRTAGMLGRPALRFNHEFMMRSGLSGLRRHLGG